jgi:hypothetical protein
MKELGEACVETLVEATAVEEVVAVSEDDATLLRAAEARGVVELLLAERG